MFSKSFEQMHGWVDARLSAYMDNQLALDERARVDAHLRECARCKKSLASLQWTIALAKQAPAPVTNKSFTLSPQEKFARAGFAIAPAAPSPTVARAKTERGALPVSKFSALRFATALATLLLVALIGFDFITQFQANPQIASAPAAEKFVAPQSAPQATNALPRAVQPQIVSTPTPLSADAAQKISPQPATGLAAQSPAPTARVEARAEPTRAPSESQNDLARQQTPLVRSAEIILVLIVFGLGVVAFRSR